MSDPPVPDDVGEEGRTSGRLVGSPADREEREAEAAAHSLRPTSLDQFVGQRTAHETMGIAIAAAKQRREPLDHLLLYGPPGLGKTTLARIVARELGVSLRPTSGPAIQRGGDLASQLSTLQEGDVLFIDEIHRLARTAEEILYPAMEDFAMDLLIGKGPGARSVRVAVKPFTLIGATTRYAMLSAPLRDRFGIVQRLDFYSTDELRTIVQRSADALEMSIDSEGVDELARRSRGTPRVANRLLRRVRDYAEVRADGVVSQLVAREALDMLGIDPLGLDERDRQLLRTVIQQFGGGPVGIDTIAAAIAEEADTIMDVYEPYLIQQGFLARTPRGRVALAAGWEHLGLSAPRSAAAGADDAVRQASFAVIQRDPSDSGDQDAEDDRGDDPGGSSSRSPQPVQ